MSVLYAFLLTLFAGLSTGIGSLMAFLTKKTNKNFLSVSLGFAAGVMIYVSFIEIFFKAEAALVAGLGEKLGTWITVASFFGGIILVAVIDKFIPEDINPHEVQKVEDMQERKPLNKKLMRTGLMTALAVSIHNFPEGLATFMAAMHDAALAIPIAVAIAIHNIPEGIAVSIPVYYGTGSRKKALLYSFLSGLAEPLGAMIGYLILMPFINDTLFGIIFAAVGGIMVFIALDELLPAAREYGKHHLAIYGMLGGMAVMAVSLLLLR
ncbi:MAG: zinc transporter ZupT [Bacillota bacterium]|jgi:ZIP family zinc transporter|nr:zinc transporter ZupT [Bacillota bacterium]HHU43025.1 zinc transporter ZupT [Clostridiales bacterium]